MLHVLKAVHVQFMHVILQPLQLSESSQCKRGAKCELEGHVVLHGRAQVNAGKVALQTVVRKKTDAQLWLCKLFWRQDQQLRKECKVEIA